MNKCIYLSQRCYFNKNLPFCIGVKKNKEVNYPCVAHRPKWLSTGQKEWEKELQVEGVSGSLIKYPNPATWHILFNY